MKCEHCGAENKIETGIKFCGKCGSRLNIPNTETDTSNDESKQVSSLKNNISDYIGIIIAVIIAFSPLYKLYCIPQIESFAMLVGMEFKTDFSFFNVVDFFEHISRICRSLGISISDSDRQYMNVYLFICGALYAIGAILTVISIIMIIVQKSNFKAKVGIWRLNRFMCLLVFISNLLVAQAAVTINDYVEKFTLSGYFGIRANSSLTTKTGFFLIEFLAFILFIASFIFVSINKKKLKDSKHT